MILVAGMAVAPVWFACGGRFRSQHGTILPSAQIILLIDVISCPYAPRAPSASPQRGRPARLVLGRGGVAFLHTVGRLSADRGAGGGARDDAAGTPAPRGAPDWRRAHAGGAHRRDSRPPGGCRGGARGAGGPARRAAADDLLSNRGRAADAVGHRRVRRRLPR